MTNLIIITVTYKFSLNFIELLKKKRRKKTQLTKTIKIEIKSCKFYKFLKS